MPPDLAAGCSEAIDERTFRIVTTAAIIYRVDFIWHLGVKMERSLTPQRDRQRERRGWLQLIAIALLMPVLFFTCVYFPILVGWTPRFP